MEKQRIFKNNPGFLTDDEVMASFIVRNQDLTNITEDIAKAWDGETTVILISGDKGSGKSMILRKIVLDLKEGDPSTNRWCPIVFPEYPHFVSSPGEFLFEALHILYQDQLDQQIGETIEVLQSVSSDEQLLKSSLSALIDYADRHGIKFLLVIDNLDVLLGDQIGWKVAIEFIQEIIAIDTFQILGSTTDRLSNGGEFLKELGGFQEVVLDSLSNAECGRLWSYINGMELPLNLYPPLGVLTGGNARLVVYLATNSGIRSSGRLEIQVESLVDDLTAHFRNILNDLPFTERKVYVALGILRKPSTARDIAEIAGFNVNTTSAYLMRLVQRGLVKVAAIRGKAKYYQPSEAMFSIFCIMQRGGMGSIEIREFLYWISFYGESQREESDFLVTLLNSDLSFLKALGDLDRSLEPEEPSFKDIAIERNWTGAWETCPDIIEFVTQNPDRVEEVIEWAQELTRQHPEDYSRKLTLGVLLGVCKGKPDEAFQYLAKHFGEETPAPTAWLIAGDLFRRHDEWELAEKCYLELITRNPNNHIDWMGLGLVYQQASQYEKAVTAYRKSLEIFPYQQILLCSLAELLHKESRNVDEAAATYFEALGLGPLPAYHLTQYSTFLLEKKDDPESALKYSEQYINNANWHDEEPWVTVELFASLTAYGYGPEALDILTQSEDSEFLDPLILGIKLYLGDEITASPEVMQIAEDIHTHIKERKQLRMNLSDRKGETA